MSFFFSKLNRHCHHSDDNLNKIKFYSVKRRDNPCIIYPLKDQSRRVSIYRRKWWTEVEASVRSRVSVASRRRINLPAKPKVSEAKGKQASRQGQTRARNSPDGRSGETRRVFRALRQESLVGSFFVGRSWLLEATGRKIVRCYCGQDVCQTLSSVFYFPSGVLLDGAFETNNRKRKHPVE